MSNITLSDSNGNVWQLTIDTTGVLIATNLGPGVAGNIATSPSSTTFTVQDVLNSTSQDIRQQLANNATPLIDYTNRIQLDLLRWSRWKFMLAPLQQFNTTAGDSGHYWIGPIGQNPGGTTDTQLNLSDVRVIKPSTVFDRTSFTRLQRADEQPLNQTFTLASNPRMYRNDVDSPFVLDIFPAPSKTFTIQFRYFRVFPQLQALSDSLAVPKDYKDIVVAGVNYLAFNFLEDAGVISAGQSSVWYQFYKDGKTQMIRDMNLFPRGGEFITPDPASAGNILNPPLATFWDGRN